jgi:hypothetical protein
MIFKNISDFSKTRDYLSILNGCVTTDLIVILLLVNKFIDSNLLHRWYKIFNLSAVIADVLIIVLGILITRFLYRSIFKTWNIVYFISLALCVQITHDLLFYQFFKSVPKGFSFILDFFKNYASDSGYKAILGDSIMVVLACLLSSYFAGLSFNTNIIIMIISIYSIPFLIYQ